MITSTPDSTEKWPTRFSSASPECATTLSLRSIRFAHAGHRHTLYAASSAFRRSNTVKSRSTRSTRCRLRFSHDSASTVFGA